MKTKSDYTPVMIFLFSLLVFAIVITVFVIAGGAKDISLRDDCRKLCIFNDMEYEGVKNGLCACNPSVNVRVYINISKEV